MRAECKGFRTISLSLVHVHVAKLLCTTHGDQHVLEVSQITFKWERATSNRLLTHSFPSSLKEQSSQQLTTPVVPQAPTPSPAAASESSRRLSPRPLGSPNDLENFHDLFYKPSLARRSSSELKPSVSPPPQVSSAPWEVHTRNRCTGSGLTSLARQLSEEFEQMALERERTSSQCYYSASSVLANNNTTQRPADGSLRFVFEESPHPESPISIAEEFSSAHRPTLAFKPSGALHEGVESSRASSVIPQGEEGDGDTAMFRVGMVESVSTPPATDHRLVHEPDGGCPRAIPPQLCHYPRTPCACAIWSPTPR